MNAQEFADFKQGFQSGTTSVVAADAKGERDGRNREHERDPELAR